MRGLLAFVALQLTQTKKQKLSRLAAYHINHVLVEHVKVSLCLAQAVTGITIDLIDRGLHT